MRLSVGTVFFGEERSGPLPPAVDQALAGSAGVAALDRSLPRLSGPARQAVRGHLDSVVAGLLDLDLTGVLVNAWATHAALRAAGTATAAEPGLEQVVDLAAHQVTWAQAPRLDVMLGGVPVGQLNIELRLTVDVSALAAVVRGGRLTHLRFGGCLAAMTIAVEGVPLVERSRPIEMPLGLSLGAGLRLTTPAPAAPPVEVRPPAA